MIHLVHRRLVLVQTCSNAKKRKLLIHGTLKDWTKFTTQINTQNKKKLCFLTRHFCASCLLSLVFKPTLSVENEEDVTLGRDEELVDLLLTGTSLRKCEHDALQTVLRLLPSFPLLNLPALHVPVTCRVSDT